MYFFWGRWREQNGAHENTLGLCEFGREAVEVSNGIHGNRQGLALHLNDLNEKVQKLQIISGVDFKYGGFFDFQKNDDLKK